MPALPSTIQGKSPVPESGPLGSVRGVRSNAYPYRDHCATAVGAHQRQNLISRWEVRKRRNYDELAKPLIEVQLVQVQPGQSRSGQAGSECCHSSGDWRVRSVHSE